MPFLMENTHCATAGDTEQNGAKHFTVARRAIVTCFRRVMIVFAGICKGKLKIVTCFARQKKFMVFFVAHKARYSHKPGTVKQSISAQDAADAGCGAWPEQPEVTASDVFLCGLLSN